MFGYEPNLPKLGQFSIFGKEVIPLAEQKLHFLHGEGDMQLVLQEVHLHLQSCLMKVVLL